MIDNILAIGGAFDWITPTLAFVNDYRYGPPAHFGASANAGFDRRDIRRVLNQAGIRVWGLILSFDGDMIMFAVNVLDAQDAYIALARAGIPLLYVPVRVEV